MHFSINSRWFAQGECSKSTLVSSYSRILRSHLISANHSAHSATLHAMFKLKRNWQYGQSVVKCKYPYMALHAKYLIMGKKNNNYDGDHYPLYTGRIAYVRGGAPATVLYLASPPVLVATITLWTAFSATSLADIDTV